MFEVYLGGAAIALILSYLGVSLLRCWAGQRMLDVPNERSSHARPTPRGGGLAIVVVTLAGIWAAFLAHSLDWSFSTVLAYTAGAVVVATVSWIDDLRSLPNRLRFGAHCLAAALALWGIGYSQGVPGVGVLDLGWLGWLATFMWIVGLTNAYNFMDGIDGLAGGQAVVAGFGWAGLGALSGQAGVGLVGLLVAASSLGFLAHNWSPAKIFMGDVGSAFLGYTFAVLTLLAGKTNPVILAAGAVLLWPFIFDATFTFLRRLRKRENVFRAHRSHLYQRLVIAGHTHRWVSTLYLGLAGAGVGCAWALASNVPGVEVWGTGAILLLALGLWSGTVWCERHRAAQLWRG